jgi:outer membrane protein OmpA-like peptidoglycan-associated protein
MLMGESCAVSANERRVRRRPGRLAVVALLLGVAACNPVDTWRDLTGVSRNDPDPETTPNTKNLAAGEASDYPNLATVPSPPVRALTAAEREKLTQSLIADRTNARHTDEQLRAGFSPVAAAPPPPPGEPGAPPEKVAAAPPSSPAPVPSTPAAVPSAASARNGASGEKPAKLLPNPPADSALANAATGVGAAGEKPALPPPGAPRATRAGGKTPAEPEQGLRKQGEPPESGPMESSLEVPQARATPEPEQIQPAPPPPQLPTPRVAAAPTPLAGGLAAGGALAPMPLPQAKSSAGYEPPPAAPELPPAPATRTAASSPGKGGAKPPAPVGTPVAEIKFGSDSTTLTDKDRQTLETILPVYQQNPGKVRIVGYAGAGSGAVEQLDSYRTALDRAQAVASALTKEGIPSDKIQVEAAPQSENSGESRAEVLLEH